MECSERLGYGAGNRRQVVSSRLGFIIRRLENGLCQLSSKIGTFSNQRRIRQQKEGWVGSAFHLLFPIYSETLTTLPYGY